MTKKFLTSFGLLSTLYLVLGTVPARAVICNPLLKDCTSSTDPAKYINNVIQVIISLLFIVAILYFLWHLIFAGYHLIATDGDPKKLETAKNELTNSIVGIFAIFSVFAIIKFVGIVLGIQGLENLTITWPSL
ncbi:MAG: hypothetical protein AAB574_03120 [Patescibacteria group bacterium]